MSKLCLISNDDNSITYNIVIKVKSGVNVSNAKTIYGKYVKIYTNNKDKDWCGDMEQFLSSNEIVLGPLTSSKTIGNKKWNEDKMIYESTNYEYRAGEGVVYEFFMDDFKCQ